MADAHGMIGDREATDALITDASDWLRNSEGFTTQTAVGFSTFVISLRANNAVERWPAGEYCTLARMAPAHLPIQWGEPG